MYFKLEDALAWSCELESYHGNNRGSGSIVTANFNIRFAPKPRTTTSTTTEITLISENATLLDESLFLENITSADEEEQLSNNITEGFENISNDVSQGS